MIFRKNILTSKKRSPIILSAIMADAAKQREAAGLMVDKAAKLKNVVPLCLKEAEASIRSPPF